MAVSIFTEGFHLGSTAESLGFFSLRFWVCLQRLYEAKDKLWNVWDEVSKFQHIGVGSSCDILGGKGSWRHFD